MITVEETLTRRVQQILPTKEGLETLMASKKIRLYQGFDPSSPDLHIGHLVGLLQLKMFQDLGHEVIFLIGDFTGMIGDPSDKSATRPKLTREEVMQNAATYKEQAGKILAFNGENAAKMLFNYDWLSKLTFTDLIEISSNLTVQQLIERDMFQERLKVNAPIHLHEFLYPVAQGYDSVHMDVDLEVGGNDQMFNLMVGRQLMKAIKSKEKYCLTTRLLTDADGKKIGKTTGNAIRLFGDPNDLYGAIMSQPDSIIEPGFVLATTLSLEEIEELKELAKSEPMKAKKRLSFEIVSLCHSESAAKTAQETFEDRFQKGKGNTVIPELRVTSTTMTILELLKLAQLSASNTQIRQVIKEGGVEYNKNKVTNPTEVINLEDGDILKYGKHTFYKLNIEQ